jgi:hypothetical protein
MALFAPKKGERVPGSGRKPGTPNKISVEVRTLIHQLVNDPAYQLKLRQDFRRRRVHPTIEALIWNYYIGKPKGEIELTGSFAIIQRQQAERERLRSLSVEQLEALAEASQALLDAALDGRALPQPPLDIVVSAKREEEPSETLEKRAGSDNQHSDNYVPNLNSSDGSDSINKG